MISGRSSLSVAHGRTLPIPRQPRRPRMTKNPRNRSDGLLLSSMRDIPDGRILPVWLSVQAAAGNRTAGPLAGSARAVKPGRTQSRLGGQGRRDAEVAPQTLRTLMEHRTGNQGNLGIRPEDRQKYGRQRQRMMKHRTGSRGNPRLGPGDMIRQKHGRRRQRATVLFVSPGARYLLIRGTRAGSIVRDVYAEDWRKLPTRQPVTEVDKEGSWAKHWGG